MCVPLYIWNYAVLQVACCQRCVWAGWLHKDVRQEPEQSSPTQTDGPVRPYLGWGSEFLGHTTAQDIGERKQNILPETGMKNLVQLSMDQPNVNRSVFNLL